MDALQLVVQLQDMSNRLEGATALNIYLLHLLGGQVTVDRDELLAINRDFSELSYSAGQHDMTIRLVATKGQKHGG